MAKSAGRGQREFDLLSTLVRAATAIEGYGSPQTAQSYPRMLDLARESGDDEALSTALLGVWFDHTVAARHQEAAEPERQMMVVAERRKNPAALADAHHAQGVGLFFTGHVGEALTALNRAITLSPDGVGRSSTDGNDPLVFALSYAAVSAWTAGYPDRAVNLIESANRRSRELNQPFSLASALAFQSWIHLWRGEVLEAEYVCEQLEVLAEGGFASALTAVNRKYQGWVASMQGEHERGIAMIRSGIAGWKLPLFLTHDSSILAAACLRAGRYREALGAVAIGREHASRTEEHFEESEIERIAGETLILIGTANTGEAEQCLRRAVAIAVEQGAKSFELRATKSLARLLSSQGKREEARMMLADIYNWFTEGFDTADLKEAKVLLDDLVQ